MFFVGIDFASADVGSYMDQVLDQKPDNLPSLRNAEDSEGSVLDLVFSAIDIILIVAGIVAVLFVSIGGVRMVVGSSSQDQVEGGKKTVYYVIIGLLVVILAWALISNFVRVLITEEETAGGCAAEGALCVGDEMCCSGDCDGGTCQ